MRPLDSELELLLCICDGKCCGHHRLTYLLLLFANEYCLAVHSSFKHIANAIIVLLFQCANIDTKIQKKKNS